MEVFDYATKKKNIGRNCTKGTKKALMQNSPVADSLFKTLYLAMLNITKNGSVTVVIGAKFISSWRFSLLIESAVDNC